MGSHPRLSRTIATCAKAAVGVALIVWLLRGIALTEVLRAIQGASVSLVGAALGMLVLNVVVCTVRWRVLLKAMNTHVPLWVLLQYYLVGIFFNTFLPSTVGGDAVRAYDIATDPRSSKAMALSVIIERLLGVTALVIIAGGGLLISGDEVGSAGSAVVIVAGVVVTGWLLLFTHQGAAFTAKLMGKWPNTVLARGTKRAFEVTLALRTNRRAVAPAFILSLLSHVTTVLAAWLVGLSLAVDAPVRLFFVFVPLIVVVTMVPISINGIGLRESGCVFFFTKVGVSAESAMAMSLVLLALTLSLGVAGGCVWVLGMRTPGREQQLAGELPGKVVAVESDGGDA